MSCKPSVPLAQPIAQALQANGALARLAQRLRASEARYAAIRDTLPEALRPHVKPGPLDDESWVLLAANAAVAAKLRQLVPLVSAALEAVGWQPILIRIRVQPA